MTDILIIGKGPAGVSAAIYAARAGKKVLVIAKDFGWLAKAEIVENYYGFEHPLRGMDLIEAGIRQAKRLGVDFVDDEVTGIDYNEHFTVKTLLGAHTAKTLILATGMSRKKSAIRNLTEYEGRGVGYCAICDAFFYRGKKVGIAGNADYAYEEALELLPFTKYLTVFTNGRDYVGTRHVPDQFDENIQIDTRKIDHLEGTEVLEKIVFSDQSQVLVDGLFVAEGTASAIDFAAKLGLENNREHITVSDRQETNIPGLFAAGDCTGGILQVSVAVGEGAKSALAAIDYLATV